MSFSPIAFVAPNYRDFKNDYLKAYEPGTTTPKVMALDPEGAVTVAKLQLNADGFVVSAGDTIVMPYIDGPYDLWLFPTEAEADANDTSNAERLADNLLAGITNTSLSIPSIFPTVAAFKASLIEFPDGKIIHLLDRGADFTKISGTGTGNDLDIIASTSVSQSIDYVVGVSIDPVHLGAVENTDSTLALQKADDLAVINKVFVSPSGGTYLLIDGIDANADWKCNGKFILKIKDNASAGTVATFNAMEVKTADVKITNLVVDGNRANQTWLTLGSANYGIAVFANDVTLSGCITKNVTANGHGIPATATRVVVDGCRSFNNGKKGLHSGDVTEVTITNGFYYNNELDSGIGLHQGIERVVITDNHCFGNGTYGIHCGDSTGDPNLDSIVSNNICFNNTINDIFIEGRGNTVSELQKFTLVTGNQVSSPKGIQLTAVNKVKICSNTLKSSQILGTNCYNTSVSNNDFYNPPADFAIKFTGGAVSQTTLIVGEHVIAQGNNFFDGTTSALVIMSDHANSKVLDNNNVSVAATYHLRTFTDTSSMEIRQTGLSLLEGSAFKDVIDVGQNRTHTTAISPAAGTWERGDRAYDDTPSATLFIGWVCVTSGSPGVWKTWGAISA